jgi:DNA-binding MarR family transcriptional regulator
VSAQQHPRHGLNETIHSPTRLSIMAALVPVEHMDFPLLRDTIQASDSLLSKHMTILETAGYVDVTKGHVGKRPRTWLALTDRGREAYTAYLDALRSLVDNGEEKRSP